MFRVFGLVLTLLILAAGLWTAFWFYAASETEHTLDAWMAGEAVQGRHWTCPGRRLTGFPVGLALACDRPRFNGLVLGDQVEGSLGHLEAGAALTNPGHAVLTLQSPFAYRSADGQTDFTITWSGMTIDLDGLPAGVSASSVRGSDIAVQGRFGASGLQAARATTGEATLAGLSDPGATVDFTITLGGAGLPGLDAIFGDTQATALDVAGRLTQAVVADAPSSAVLIDRWRLAGGSITFAMAKLTRGGSQLSASGPLHLDDLHRIAGRLDATFIGLAPLLRRYGINPGLATAGSILNSLFGGKPAESADPGALRLPIVFQNGRLGVGPIVTPIGLPPLY